MVKKVILKYRGVKTVNKTTIQEVSDEQKFPKCNPIINQLLYYI